MDTAKVKLKTEDIRANKGLETGGLNIKSVSVGCDLQAKPAKLPSGLRS